MRTIIALARRDSRYWRFPLALSALSVASVYGQAWLRGVTLPWWVVAAVGVWAAALSTLTAWWLLLGRSA